MDGRQSADGATPMQPGKSAAIVPETCLQVSSGPSSGSGSRTARGGTGETSVGAVGLLGFLERIKDLVQKFEQAGKTAVGPAAAWVPPLAGSGENVGSRVSTEMTAVAGASTVPAKEGVSTVVAQGTDKTAVASEMVAMQDIIRIADAAKCEVYVCYEGPLGAHLKQEVREKLWKGEYVEIFSLLPLEKFKT